MTPEEKEKLRNLADAMSACSNIKGINGFLIIDTFMPPLWIDPSSHSSIESFRYNIDEGDIHADQG